MNEPSGAAGRDGLPTADEAAVTRRLARAVTRARLVLLWETVWRAALAPMLAGGTWIGCAWIGLFDSLGDWGRPLAAIGGLAVVAGLALGAGRRIVATPIDRAAALRRIETASGLIPHELADQADGLADPAASAATRALWAAHRRRAAARLGRLAVGVPRPDLPRRDRWALRPLVGFLLFVGWMAAGEERGERLVSALRLPPPAAVVADRIDVWIDPPAHTGRPPLVLALDADGAPPSAERGGDGARVITVPAGSRLVARVAAGEPSAPARPVSVTATPPGAVTAVEPAAAGEGRWTIESDGAIDLVRDGRRLAGWRIVAEPDRAPTIRLIEAGAARGRGATRLAYEVEDDWGVESAQARFALPRGGAPAARPLYEAPTLALALPGGPRRAGRAETARDLSAHPFAGARLDVIVTARDAIGQEGVSAASVVVAERPFRVPVARALIELRRRLALDAGEIGAVRIGLDGLTLAPERFAERAGRHLGLRHLAAAANRAVDDDALRALCDQLWTAAVTIETGDTLDEEKALAEARDALRKALESGASEEEIRRLTQELRAAMEKWLEAKSAAARRDADPAARAGERGRRVTDKDLRRMVDRIEELGRTGSRQAAEELLAQLGETLDALQAGRPSRGGEDALDRMGEMIRRQRELMDETHRAERDGAEPRTRGRLADEQQRLREALRQLGREMGRDGEAPAAGADGRREGPGEALDEADGAMGEAGRALEQAEGGEAVEAQGRALEALKRGARALADRQTGEGEREGEGGSAREEEDPSGRPRRSRDASSSRVKIPEAIDVERARRILDDIRRRLADPERPRLERDYLDRLLRLE